MAIINLSGLISSSFETTGVLVNAAQAAGDAVFTIDLRPTNPVIIVQDNLDYGVMGWNINDVVAVIILIGPEGEIYRNEDFENPDIVPATSRYLNKTITLPLDPLTDYTNILKGNYTLKISWYNSVLDEYYNFLKTYQYDFDPPTIANTTVSGPYTGILKSTDTTEYGNDVYQVIREHRVQYPDELDPQPPDIVSSNAEIQVSPIYTNEWTIIINSFVEYRQSDTLRIFWEGTGEFTHCVYGGCIGAMYDAIVNMLNTYTEELACNLISKELYQHRLVTLNTAWHLLNEAYWSGDAEGADEQAYIIQEQVAYTGSGTCGGPSSEEVTPCPPWTGGGVGGTYTFENGLTEGAGVVVLGGTLNQNTTILTGDYDFVVSGSSGGNTVSLSVDAATPVIAASVNDGDYGGEVSVGAGSVALKYTDIATPANNITYTVGDTGIVEAADYSGVYTDRTLVAKSYVDGLIAGVSSYTFENGLTESSGVVKLGGTLTDDTVVDYGSYYLLLGDAFSTPPKGYGYFASDTGQIGHIESSSPILQSSLYASSDGIWLEARDDTDVSSIAIDFTVGMQVSDQIFNRGLFYVADYSSQWTDFSLVTKKWVEDNFGSEVDTFTELTDTPSSYSGFGGYFVRVNTGATALEFVTGSWVASTGGTFTGQVTISTSTDRPLVIHQVGAGSNPGTPEGGINLISFEDNDGDEQGYIGIDASGNIVLHTAVTGGEIVTDNDVSVDGDVSVSGTIIVDTVNEYTGNNGVIIEGVTIKDGVVEGFIPESLFDANTIIAANVDDTPLAVTIAEDRIVGRISGGNITALTGVQVMNVIWSSPPAAPGSTGTTGEIAYDDDYLYVCIATDTWVRAALATNWV